VEAVETEAALVKTRFPLGPTDLVKAAEAVAADATKLPLLGLEVACIQLRSRHNAICTHKHTRSPTWLAQLALGRFAAY
jgi:hypothetical protein